MIKVVDGTRIDLDDRLSNMEDDELRKYIQYVKDRVDTGSKQLTISVILCDDGKIDLNYELKQPFERIRRITGYLTGSLDSWNNSKRAEEKERVKHSLDNFEHHDEVIENIEPVEYHILTDCGELYKVVA